MWTEEKIQQYIDDGYEESLTLEYKAAGAVLKRPDRNPEIHRDVSAFANSAGGIIIYGVKEFSGDKKHLPEKIDPISRKAFSKEQLEHIIGGIQPRIAGIVIHSVSIGADPDHCCYVVEILQSDTAHQATDFCYYRRHNFERLPMEDYEIREAMNRAKHPKIDVKVFLNLHDNMIDPNYFLVRLENVGKRIAKQYLCAIKLPLEAKSRGIHPIDPVVLDKDEFGYSSLRISMPDPINDAPLFPGCTHIHKRPVEYIGRPDRFLDGTPVKSIDYIEITLFADEMEPVKRIIPVEDALGGWI